MNIWHFLAPVSGVLMMVYNMGLESSTIITILGTIVLIIYCIVDVHMGINNMFVAKAAIKIDKQDQALKKMRKFLKVFDREAQRPNRLPAVFGRSVDDILQTVIDLILRDFVGTWNSEQGFGSTTALCSDLKEDIWRVVQNFQARLSTIDVTKLVCEDFVNRITFHFQQIRLTNEATHIGRAPAHSLPTHLESTANEINYLRNITSTLLLYLVPQSYLQVLPVKHVLQEFIACKVLFPVVEKLTDPDYINQQILTWLSSNLPKSGMECKNVYNYPESYDEFVKMIQELQDIAILKQIRYDILVEIIQASGIHNLDGGKELAEGNQVKRYINQLSFAKKECEKRLNDLGWTSQPVEQAMEASAQEPTEVFPLKAVLKTPKARVYLREYLEQINYAGLISYWEAVDNMGNNKMDSWHGIATEIFYSYVFRPPSPVHAHVPSIDFVMTKSVQKQMEAYLLGNDSPQIFFQVQERVFEVLEERFYPAFLESENYHRMTTSIKLCDLVNPDGDSEDYVLYLSPKTSMDVGDLDEIPTHVPDESDYTRCKLRKLRRRLQNKVHALKALSMSLKPESRVLASLENEVEALKADFCQMEAHVLRTEAWGKHLGQWRSYVQTTELSEDGSMQFVLVVHILEDDKDADAVSTGWVVLRKLQEFHKLHEKLCQLSPLMKSMEVPSLYRKLTFAFGQKTFKESESSWLLRAKDQIQKYLQFVLEDEKLNHSEALYKFLSPSSDHLKRVEPLPKKSKFSFSTLFKSNCDQVREGGASQKEPVETDISLLCDEPGGSNNPGDTRDTIAEPLFELLNELCDLNTTFKWIRRTIITTIQVTYNRSINRAIRAIISEWFSVHNAYNCILAFAKSWWPLGVLVNYNVERSTRVKKQTRNAASSLLNNNIPLALSNLVGFQNAQLGVTKVFNALQDPQLNKQLCYDLVDIFLRELCPELKEQ